jgi:hypothetical protein
MVAFSKITAGDVLWDCHRTQMGNTTMRQMSCWKVTVIEVHEDRRTALVSWNGNKPRVYSERDIGKLRRTKVEGAR